LKPFQILREIKSVSFATVSDGAPQVRIVDVMLVEDETIYFLTARGKHLYKQLLEGGVVAVAGMTPEYRVVRLNGRIRQVEREWLDKIFVANPMMSDLYPGEKRDILEAFCIYSGVGEIFDLGTHPPCRSRFSFGGAEVQPPGYQITESCTACGACLPACPIDVISEGEIYRIDGERCLECGRCQAVCPVDAIEPGGGL
jgi:uncharacterized pyridoxamine 5'-phosphate oxidase family protein/NAD-dependent dihydropyrimidine dehydrogenase PreA subunit